MSKGKKRKPSGRVLCEQRLKRQQAEEAGNRRELLASVDKKTAVFAANEFAKLGLFQ